MVNINCANIYTISAEAGETYRVSFPSQGSVCVKNGSEDSIDLFFDEGTVQSGEYITVDAGEAVNDLYVPAGVLLITAEGSGNIEIMYR